MFQEKGIIAPDVLTIATPPRHLLKGAIVNIALGNAVNEAHSNNMEKVDLIGVGDHMLTTNNLTPTMTGISVTFKKLDRATGPARIAGCWAFRPEAPDSLVSASCTWYGTEEETEFRVSAGEAAAGKTCLTAILYPFTIPDIFAEIFQGYYGSLLEQAADFPLKGVANDEWGFDLFLKWEAGRGFWVEDFPLHAFAGRWIPGKDGDPSGQSAPLFCPATGWGRRPVCSGCRQLEEYHQFSFYSNQVPQNDPSFTLVDMDGGLLEPARVVPRRDFEGGMYLIYFVKGYFSLLVDKPDTDMMFGPQAFFFDPVAENSTQLRPLIARPAAHPLRGKPVRIPRFLWSGALKAGQILKPSPASLPVPFLIRTAALLPAQNMNTVCADRSTAVFPNLPKRSFAALPSYARTELVFLAESYQAESGEAITVEAKISSQNAPFPEKLSRLPCRKFPY